MGLAYLSTLIVVLAYLLQTPAARGEDFVCPSPTAQSNNDIKMDIDGKASTLFKIGNADLKGSVQKTVVDLFSKYPNADRVAIINTMLSVDCNIIKNSTTLSDSEKLDKWMIVFPAVQSLMPAAAKP
jgi:hypothetical protein